MAKKKASPVKSARPAGGKAAKNAVKKSTTKKAVKKKASPAKKSIKKSVPKRAVTKALPVKKTPAKVSGSKNGRMKSVPAEKKVTKDKVQLLADAAVEGILELKGRNITIMNLKKIHNRVCDYYIICQADSNTQVNAIAASVEETIKKKTGEKPYRSEGFQNSEWILVDYVTVVVHIFQSHIRNFYNLESLWADADITELAFD